MHPPASRTLALRTSTVTYPGSTEHVAAVRADLRPLLRDCPVADEVILCASELAANAAVHSLSRLPGGTFRSGPRSIPANTSRFGSRTTAVPGRQGRTTPQAVMGWTSCALLPAPGAPTAIRRAAPPGRDSTGRSVDNRRRVRAQVLACEQFLYSHMYGLRSSPVSNFFTVIFKGARSAPCAIRRVITRSSRTRAGVTTDNALGGAGAKRARGILTAVGLAAPP
jgi:hypothetical protein